MTSFGHAAYFGLGAYGGRARVQARRLPMRRGARWSRRCVAVRGRACCSAGSCVRLRRASTSAMLTLAFAQIVWSMAFQWDRGHRRRQRHRRHLAAPAALARARRAYYLLTLALAVGAACCAARRAASRRSAIALRAVRDCAAARRRHRHRRRGACSGRAFARRRPVRRAGRRAERVLRRAAMFARTRWRSRSSVDALVMVLLGGLQTLSGPLRRRRRVHLAAGRARRAAPTTGALVLGARRSSLHACSPFPQRHRPAAFERAAACADAGHEPPRRCAPAGRATCRKSLRRRARGRRRDASTLARGRVASR
ncbi:MAG: hypothetical protein MZW92_40080 [Comamonadaceae bacterium]|nr:hypothetical protein [Comamonadaceae bacterium]